MRRVLSLGVAVLLAAQAHAVPPFMSIMMKGRAWASAPTTSSITFIRSTTFGSSASATTQTATIPAATAGDILIAVCGSDTTVTSVTGFAQQLANVSGQGQYIFTKIATGGETSVVFNLGSSDSLGAIIYEVSGIASATVDKTATNLPAGSQTTCASGTTATLSNASEIAVACWVWNDNSNPGQSVSTVSNSYNKVTGVTTVGSTTNIRVDSAYLIVAATTATSSTATLSAGVNAPQGEIGTFH